MAFRLGRTAFPGTGKGYRRGRVFRPDPVALFGSAILVSHRRNDNVGFIIFCFKVFVIKIFFTVNALITGCFDAGIDTGRLFSFNHISRFMRK